MTTPEEAVELSHAEAIRILTPEERRITAPASWPR